MPIAKELKKQGSKIIFFAIYEKSTDVFYTDKIEKLADETHVFILSRNDDGTDDRSINDLMTKIKAAKSSNNSYIICYTTSEMLITMKKNGQELLEDSKVICNILAPMQCMMKGICGQCIQKIDDNKGYIFSCACQEYEIKKFDPKLITKRLEQNSLLEKIIQY